MKYLNMKVLKKLGIAFAGAGLLVFGLGNEANAQVENPLTVDGRVGLALTTGDFSDSNDAGFDFGLGLGYYVTERLSVRADFEGGFFEGTDVTFGGVTVAAPDAQVLTYTAGLGYDLTDRALTPWRFSVNAGLGASTVNLSYDDDALADIETVDTYFAINYGARLGYGVTDNADIFLGVKGITTFGENADETANNLTTIPITVGAAFRF